MHLAGPEYVQRHRSIEQRLTGRVDKREAASVRLDESGKRELFNEHGDWWMVVREGTVRLCPFLHYPFIIHACGVGTRLRHYFVSQIRYGTFVVLFPVFSRYISTTSLRRRQR